jgi:hypothetical protein
MTTAGAGKRSGDTVRLFPGALSMRRAARADWSTRRRLPRALEADEGPPVGAAHLILRMQVTGSAWAKTDWSTRRPRLATCTGRRFPVLAQDARALERDGLRSGVRDGAPLGAFRNLHEVLASPIPFRKLGSPVKEVVGGQMCPDAPPSIRPNRCAPTVARVRGRCWPGVRVPSHPWAIKSRGENARAAFR